jgi:hypothetical protein
VIPDKAPFSDGFYKVTWLIFLSGTDEIRFQNIMVPSNELDAAY